LLSRLHIRNYAIISEVSIDFSNGLTIITGETGAGKSILIGALSLVLGKRADSSVLFNKEEKCIVEAYFDISDHSLNAFFEQHNLDYEPISIIRREINPQGKSRAFVNDTPVNLTQLKELTAKLIDIHSQHAVLTLKTTDFRTRFLDACSDGGKQFLAYAKAYSNWLQIKTEVDALKKHLQQATADEDYLKFQLEELEELNIKEGTLKASQEQLSLLENATEIRESLSAICQLLSNTEHALISGLRNVDNTLQRLANNYSNANDWQKRISENLIDLEDIADDIARQVEEVDEKPEELQRLQQRVDEILRLMTKHNKHSEAELIAFSKQLDEKLQAINSSDEQLILLNTALEKADLVLTKEAQNLSKLRKKTATRLSPILTKELTELGMPEAQVNVYIEKGERTVLGQDKIDIRFTANKGQQLQDISKVASGGELSRLMLVVKAEMAKNTKLPAIIFDEIDTGVSGEVAGKMGLKINSLSNEMQVLCITHLPQIASKANQHLFVYKRQEKDRTVTKIKVLEKTERITEIAKMLSNAHPTDTALQHAKDLISNN